MRRTWLMPLALSLAAGAFVLPAQAQGEYQGWGWCSTCQTDRPASHDFTHGGGGGGGGGKLNPGVVLMGEIVLGPFVAPFVSGAGVYAGFDWVIARLANGDEFPFLWEYLMTEWSMRAKLDEGFLLVPGVFMLSATVTLAVYYPLRGAVWLVGIAFPSEEEERVWANEAADEAYADMTKAYASFTKENERWSGRVGMAPPSAELIASLDAKSAQRTRLSAARDVAAQLRAASSTDVAPQEQPARSEPLLSLGDGALEADVPPICPQLEREPRELGSLSEKYETGGRGAGAVSSGVGDPGGVSYGSYQMTSRNGGTVQRFVNEPRFPWSATFEGLTPGTREFSAAWRTLAQRESTAFARAQRDFIRRTHYEPQLAEIAKARGVDVASLPSAVQDAVWSSAVQHGPATQVVVRALDKVKARRGKLDVAAPGFARDLLEAIYAERSRKSDGGSLAYFASSSASVQRGVERRLRRERRDALSLLRQDGCVGLSNAMRSQEFATDELLDLAKSSVDRGEAWSIAKAREHIEAKYEEGKERLKGLLPGRVKRALDANLKAVEGTRGLFERLEQSVDEIVHGTGQDLGRLADDVEEGLFHTGKDVYEEATGTTGGSRLREWLLTPVWTPAGGE